MSSANTRKWISLSANSSVNLKVTPQKDGTLLVITGLRRGQLEYRGAVNDLGFNALPDSDLITKLIPKGQNISPSDFRAVWPQARIADVKQSDYILSDSDKEEIKQARSRGNRGSRTKTSGASWRWIDLNDKKHGAVLKAGRYNGKITLVIEGLKPRTAFYQKVIDEKNFIPTFSGAFLVKVCAQGERVQLKDFIDLWPDALVRELPRSEYTIDFDAKAARKRQAEQAKLKSEGGEPDNSAENNILDELNALLHQSKLLGLNDRGLSVYRGVEGRFFINADSKPIYESDKSYKKSDFLKGGTLAEVTKCASGLLQSCLKGSPFQGKQIIDFAKTVFDLDEQDELSQNQKDIWLKAIDSAIVADMVEDYDSNPASAWGRSVFYEEMLPGINPLRSNYSHIPYPVGIAIQRLLANEDSAVVSGAKNTLAFSLLASMDGVFVNDLDDFEAQDIDITSSSVFPLHEQDRPAQSGVLFLSDFDDVLASEHLIALDDGALSLVYSDSLESISVMTQHVSLENAIAFPAHLSGLGKETYLLIGRKKEEPIVEAQEVNPIRVYSWDSLKMVLDESFARLNYNLDQASHDATSVVIENKMQRPYLAFSKIGTASTMVPRNMQAALAQALSKVVDNYGSIDEFVSQELGMGFASLQERFSPEQIDAIALGLHKTLVGGGFIIGDETGIGKGRTISALASHALSAGKKIIFVTDRSNLFSDIARDMRDIGQWERFNVLATNADGVIIDTMGTGEAEVLLDATPDSELRKIMASETHPYNLILTTYSQMSREGSVKANWLAEQSRDAYLILDEAHIAAGDKSNISKQVQKMTESAHAVLYSSATWAKTLENPRIYARALPESINPDQMRSTMGAEELSAEIFSTMLALDGSFIRREHDLSKVEIIMDEHDSYSERNSQIAEQVAEVLGLMAALSGEINNVFQRINVEARQEINNAKSARYEIQSRVFDSLWRRESIEDEIKELNERAIQAQSPHSGLDADGIQGELNDKLAELKQIDDSLGPQQERLRALNARRVTMFQSGFGTGGAIHVVSRRLNAALLADHCADRILEAIDKNQKPVVVFDETGETFIRQSIEREFATIKADVQKIRDQIVSGDELDDEMKELSDLLDSGAKPVDVVKKVRMHTLVDLLNSYLESLGGVLVTETAVDEDDESSSDVSVMKSLQGLSGIDEDLIEVYERGVSHILEKIAEIPDLSIMPIDVIKSRLASHNLRCGEISGRNFELVPDDPENPTSGQCEIVMRNKSKASVNQTTSDFNSGKLDVLFINQSAATGISLHSSPRFADTRQRALIELQGPLDPAKLTQLLGRTNRHDQVIPPEMMVLNTGVTSERRAKMIRNKKLAQMSATVRSSKENAVIDDDVPDFFNSVGDRVAQEYLLENPGVSARLNINIDRIKDAYGLSYRVMQLLTLLSKRDYERVFSDLTLAYEDAVLEAEMNLSAHSVSTKNWRARTVSETHAWGPSEHLDALSVFDGPVKLRRVEYVYDYQPLHWSQVRQKIIDSSTQLLGDDRVSLRKADYSHVGAARDRFAAMVDPRGDELAAERDLDKAAQEELFKDAIFSEIVTSLENTDEQIIGFSARQPGSWQQKRMFAVISDDKSYVDIYNPVSDERFNAYRLDLGNAVRDDVKGHECIVDLPIDEENKASIRQWVDNEFNRIWASVDSQVSIVSTQKAIDSAVAIFKQKQIIAVAQGEFESIEQALGTRENDHNAVKEAFTRGLFVEKVLSKLVPGTQMYFKENLTRNPLGNYGSASFIVTGITLPPKGEEGTLSKWKFHIARSTEEKPTTISGAILFKRAGKAPLFKGIEVVGNIFDPLIDDINSVSTSFDQVPKGEVKVYRNLLVGNDFKALSWAQETKGGSPIMYSDENGVYHRAVELTQVLNTSGFPIVLNQREMIVDFINRAYENESIDSVNVYTTFKSAMAASEEAHASSRRSTGGDSLHLHKQGNFIILSMDRSLRASYRTSLRNAIANDKSNWEYEHPDTPYPIDRFGVGLVRASRGFKYANVRIDLPESKKGRERLLSVLIRSQGLQLCLPTEFTNANSEAVLQEARNAEKHFYESLAKPDVETLAKIKTARDRRQGIKEILNGLANDSLSSEILDKSESSEPVDNINDKTTSVDNSFDTIGTNTDSDTSRKQVYS